MKELQIIIIFSTAIFSSLGAKNRGNNYQCLSKKIKVDSDLIKKF